MPRALILASDAGGTLVSPGNYLILGSAKSDIVHVTQAFHQLRARIPGHFCFLGGRSIDLTDHGQSVQFQVNGVDGTQAVALPIGWFQTADQDVIADGDLWNLAVADGTSGTIITVFRAVFTADGDQHSTYHSAWIDYLLGPNSTAIWALAGNGGGGGGRPEGEIQLKYGVAGTLAFLQVYISQNDLSTDSHIRLRINGANKTQDIIIPAGMTGLFEDQIHSDAVAAGDLVTISATSGIGTGFLAFKFAAICFTATSGSAADMLGMADLEAGQWTGAIYIPIGGYGRAGTAVESDVKTRIGFPATLSKLRFYVRDNARSDITTVRLRINGSDGNQVQVVPAGTTGWFEDDVNTDIVGENDDVVIVVDTPAPLAFFSIKGYGVAIADNGGGAPCNASIGPTTPHETPPLLTAEAEIAPRELVLERIANQRWLIRSAHLRQWGEITIDDLSLTIKRGIGTADTEPAIWVRANRDNKGFGKWTKRGLGLIGDRIMVLGFGGFGCARDWQFEIATSDDCEIELRKAEILATPLGH